MEKKYNKTQKAKERRLRVIERLEEQLKTGQKRVKTKLEKELAGNGVNTKQGLFDSLKEGDTKRIKKEIETLKTRI